jgi:hypothetical protein
MPLGCQRERDPPGADGELEDGSASGERGQELDGVLGPGRWVEQLVEDLGDPLSVRLRLVALHASGRPRTSDVASRDDSSPTT